MRLASIFFVSVSLHALVCYSMGYSPVLWQTRAEPIEVSYVQYAEKVKTPPPAAPVPAVLPEAPVKKIAAKTVVQKPPVLSPVKPPPAPVQSPRQPMRYLAPVVSAPRPVVFQKTVPPAAPKTSAELIADPKKGKIFVGYFSLLREKIHKTLRDHYDDSSAGAGSVCLYFVLDPSGKIERASVVEKESDASEPLKILAMRCLHESAPFAAFPKNLSAEDIAFNVTVFFGEN